MKNSLVEYASDPRNIMDWAALGNAALVVLGYLPELAAGASIVWIAIQAYYFIKEKRKGK